MLHHEIFRPSESWIHKSGVKLEYTPEDTLKSFILLNGRELTNQWELDNRESYHRDGDESSSERPTGICELENGTDGHMKTSVVNIPDKNDVSSSKNKSEAGRSSMSKDDVDKQNPRKPSQLKKPAAFLRRRHGMSAWCSKLKRQGMPVKDPSEDLRKRQVPEQSNVSVRNAAIEINQGDKVSCNMSTDILQPSRSESICDNRKVAIKGITGGFICGLMHRRRSVSPSRGSTSNAVLAEACVIPNISIASKQSIGSSQPPTTVSSLTDNSVRKHATISSTRSSDGSVRDAIDLQEFELLEEIVENHSLSSLSSIFASGISDKTRSIEGESHQPPEEDNSLIHAADEESSRPPGSPELPSSHVPEAGILSLMEKHRTQGNSDRPTSPHEPNRYSLGVATKEPRKVTRFRLDGEGYDNLDAEYPGGRSPRTRRSPDKVPLTARYDALQEVDGNRDELTDKDDNFDDAFSWAGGSATDLHKLTLEKRQTSVKRTHTSESRHSSEWSAIKSSTTVDREADVTTPSPGKSISDLGPCLARSLPNNDSCYYSTSTGAPAVDTGSLQGPSEEHMTCFADDLVKQMKRDAPDLNNQKQSNRTTVLRQWISRLESEVMRFKKENASMTKLRAEHEENLRKLNLDVKRFEEAKLKELNAFNVYKEAELHKIKKERRVLDDYQRALKSMPSKKDREEIDRLKEQLIESRTETGRREAHWQAAVGRLRTRLEEVERERTELRDRVRRLEEERVTLQAALSAERSLAVGGAGSKGHALRHTLNSLTQSVSLKPDFASVLSDPTNNCTERSRRALQHRQQLSSCRLASSRSTAISRMRAASSITTNADALRKSLLEQQQKNQRTRTSPNQLAPQRRSSSSSSHGRPGRHGQPHGDRDQTGGQISSRSPACCPPGLPSSRESVVSGSTGYHTVPDDEDGDDVGSVHSPRLTELLLSTGSRVASDALAGLAKQLSTTQQSNQGDEASDRECEHRLQLGNQAHLTTRSPMIGKAASAEPLEEGPAERLPAPGTAAFGAVVRMVKHANGSTEHTYRNGAVVICYANGSVKEIFSDNVTTVVSLYNGDIKRTLPDGRVIYHYATDGTVQTTYPDGSETIEYVDGRQEVIQSDVNRALACAGGGQSDTIPVGVDVEQQSQQEEQEDNQLMKQQQRQEQQLVRRLPNGDREIQLANGQREIHSVTGIKCRIYPDGTTKTVFPDGRHETRYASGRLRIRDVHGNLMLDTRLPVPHRLIATPSGTLSTMPSPRDR